MKFVFVAHDANVILMWLLEYEKPKSLHTGLATDLR